MLLHRESSRKLTPMTASHTCSLFCSHFQGIVLPRLLLGGVLLWTSSCASVDRWAAGVQKPLPRLARTESASGVTHAFATQEEAAGGAVRPLSHEIAAKTPSSDGPLARESEGVTSVSGRPASSGAPAGAQGQIQQMSAEFATPASDVVDPLCPVISLPGEPRTQLFCPPVASCPPVMSVMPLGPRAFPPESSDDEYICDGGDRGLPVHYDSFQRLGLDLEDTVAEFPDETGKVQVRASNRVCVYAPRFGSVRSMTATNEDFAFTRAAGTHEKATVAGYDHRMVLDERVQRDALFGLDMRSRASGLGQLQVDESVASDVRAGQHELLLNVFEEYTAFKEGRFDRIDTAVLALATDTAFEWSQQQASTIQGHYRGGQMVEAKVYAQEYVGVEDRSTPGDLRITKIVDKTVALPGDEITFAVRFDNVGDREIMEVRVIDNLSPRLQYVTGSVQSNLGGKLDVQPNGDGGEVLTFDFAEPLAGKTGGWFSFRCKVR